MTTATAPTNTDSPLGGQVPIWTGRKLGRTRWQFSYNGHDFYESPGGSLVAVPQRTYGAIRGTSRVLPPRS